MMLRFCCVLVWAWSAGAQTISFHSSKTGAVPPAWTVAMTHEGGPPKWEIVADPSAPSKPQVLAQTSTDNTSGRFPLAIWDQASFANGTVSVRFKPVSGERDQAAVAIQDDAHRLGLAEWQQEIGELGIVDVLGEIAYVQFHESSSAGLAGLPGSRSSTRFQRTDPSARQKLRELRKGGLLRGWVQGI